MRKEFVGQLISEATAMFIILAFGDSVAAMYTLYSEPMLRISRRIGAFALLGESP